MIHLALGTAQLGMPYGISNKVGQPDQETATAIVKKSWDSGVRYFDTARGYGVSERALGQALHDLDIQCEARVITKISASDECYSSKFKTELYESLQELGVPSVYGVMLHNENLLDRWNDGVARSLLTLKDEGRVKHLGVSLYSPERALAAIRTPGIDMIQLPLNVFDLRMLNAGVISEASVCGVKVFIRSAYLQGLALMNTVELPANMQYAAPAIERYSTLCRKHSVGRSAFALGYIRAKAPEAIVVVGAETVQQARENAEMICCAPLDLAMIEEWERLWCCEGDLDLVDPSRWPMKDG